MLPKECDIMATKKTVKKKSNSTDKPVIKVTNISNGWTSGKITYKRMNSYFEMKNFIEKSQFGINKGCISKLHIVFSPTDSEIVHYDRGWDVKPKSDYAKTVYRALLREFNNGMPEIYVNRWLKSIE